MQEIRKQTGNKLEANWLNNCTNTLNDCISAKLNSVAFANANVRPGHYEQVDDFTVVNLIVPSHRGDHPGSKIEETS